MVTSAQGIDVSAFQVDLTVHDLSGLAFAFTKATDGTAFTDPNFTHNWGAIKAAGLHRGAYHELQAGSGGAQAAHFLAVVQAGGLKPGDMLAVVASDYPGVTDAEVLTFCADVKAATNGHNPVLVYTDLSIGAGLGMTSAAGYPLWVAWPSPVAPPMPLAHWHDWVLWQWGIRFIPGLGSVDADAFNGTPAQMGTWIASFFPAPPKPPAPAAILEDPVLLKTGAGSVTPVAFPTQATSLRLSCEDTAEVTIEFHKSAPFSAPLTWGQGSEVFTIPGNARCALITRVDSGLGDVSAVTE